jgi:hypothetical protein
MMVKPFVKPVPYRTIGIVWRPTSPRRVLFEVVGAALRELSPNRASRIEAASSSDGAEGAKRNGAEGAKRNS